MRLLVTGGAGYIGSHVGKLLQERGERVLVFDSLELGHRDAVCCDLIQGNLLNEDDLERAMQTGPFDAVLHFAAYALVGESMQDPVKYYRNNVMGGIRLIEAMLRHGIPSIVFSSTAAVYGTPHYTPIDERHATSPINPYGASKRMLEKILQDLVDRNLINAVILRYFNAAGASVDGRLGEDHDPETHLIPLVIQAALGMRESVSIFGTDYQTEDGTCVRDYIHVDDLAMAHVLALQRLQTGRSGVYNLGNGRGYSVREVVESVKMVSGKSFRILEAARREGDPDVLLASSRSAHDELGWHPQHPAIEEIVETAWKWLTDHPRGYRA